MTYASEWNGKLMSEIPIEILINEISRIERQHGTQPLGKGVRHKYFELMEELNRRERIIQRNEYQLFETALIDLAKGKGIPIPASGAGVYFEIEGRTFRITSGKLVVRYDVVKRLPRQKGQDQGRSPKGRNSSGRRHKGSKSRVSK